MDDPREIEEHLRNCLEQAKARLEAAKTNSDAARQDAKHLPSPDGGYAYRHALRVEGEARDEFTRLLLLFNDLTIRGSLPSKDELPPAVCPHRLRLRNELRSIMDHIVGLNKEMAGALLIGDITSLEVLEGQVRNARQLKDRLLEQFKAHVAQHHC